MGTVLTATGTGSACSFTYSTSVAGNAGTDHVNVFTATVKDDESNPVSATDDATVSFTDVAPTITVTKAADPTSVPETGGTVSYNFTVTNTSAEPVTITELSDDTFGALAGDGDCRVTTVLAASGDSCTFSYTTTLVGNAGTTHVNTFTAKAVDDDRSEATATDTATVTFTNVAPSVVVTKTADPTSVPETGGMVSYTFTVTNTSAEPVTVRTLVDDKFGDLVGDADCTVGTVLGAAGTPNDSCSFTLAATLPAQEAQSTHTNVFTATVIDDDGSDASDDAYAIVTFLDVPPTITVDKTADPTSVPETGGTVTFTYTVTNTSAESVTIASLGDDQFTAVTGNPECRVGTVLAAGASCEFTYSTDLAGNAGLTHVNVFEVTAEDNDGSSVTARDDATVTFSDVLPDVSVTKTANPTSVPETGGDVTFTFKVTNNSAETATITALADSVFGTLTGDADCQVGTVLAGGASCSFSIDRFITGDYPAVHTNVFTATVEDNDGNTDDASDDEQVPFTDVKPAVTMVKSAAPASVPETGGTVTFTFTVTNDSTEDATITTLSDSVFGTLTGDTDCRVGTVLTGGTSCDFTIERVISGEAATDHTNVGTVTVTDDDGNPASDTDTESRSHRRQTGRVGDQDRHPTSVPETGGDVTFTFTVTNNSAETATITALADSVFGTLTGDADCQVGTVLAGGASCEFALVRAVSGDVGGRDHVNVFTGTVTDNENNTDSATDDATVTFTDVKPAVTVTTTANPTTVPETGGTVTYTFTVTNDSTEKAMVTALTDDRFGTLAGSPTCKVGTYLNAGTSCSFTVTRWISGDFPGSHTNVFTATVGDDDGNTATDQDDAVVAFSDVLPDIVMTKTANPTSIPFQGGQVIYTFVVWNRSAETATLTTLTDNRFGDLDGKGNCDVPVSLAASDGVQGGADTYTCTYLVTFGRQTVAPGGTGFTPHVNVATAVATDDDTNSDTATDDASVSFTWRGRTPGYWKNHTAEWPKFSVVNTAGVSVQVTPTTKVRSVFAVPATSTYSCIKSTDTLSTALGYKGGSTTCGAAQILLREAASALLNEAMFGDAYPGATSVQSLITQVNTTLATNDRTKILALATYLDYWNNGVH